MNYSVIIPAYNEEKYIEKTLNSVVNQTILPTEVIIVDDNSTDNTKEICYSFCEKHTFISVIHKENDNSNHQPGAKVIHAFNKGFAQLQKDWDIIVKLDADIILPHNYFEEIITAFKKNNKLGMASGLIYIFKDNQWVYENIADKNHVRGPIKAYRKECFNKIGGLRASIGWDTVDELLAQYHSYEVETLPDLKIKHLKPTAFYYQKSVGKKMGAAFYKMRYGFLISLIAALKASKNAKSFRLFIGIMKAYLFNQLNAKEHIVSKEEGEFIRNYRWKNIIKKLKKA